MIKIAIPTSKGGLEDKVHESLVRAETFTLVEVKDGKIERIEVVENPHKNEPYGAGSKVAIFLVNNGVNILLTPMDCPKGKQYLKREELKLSK